MTEFRSKQAQNSRCEAHRKSRRQMPERPPAEPECYEPRGDNAMSLKEVFNTRTDRAARVLDDSSAGPKKICFSSTDLSTPEKLEKLHAQFPGKKQRGVYLYQVSIDGNHGTLASQARKAFRQVRAEKRCNMSRDNDWHPDSGSLYVGTSENLYDRFRTHLGRGAGKTTWALYLAEWASNLKIKFVVEYYELTETISEDVELIEGVLWDYLLPLFGKKGGK